MREFGGPEVLEPAELAVPEPRDGEVLIEVARAGINFADTHTTSNSYVRKATLPLVPGVEVAGTIVGSGERVVALTWDGGYAEYATARREHVFPIAHGIDDGTALALLIQGTTANPIFIPNVGKAIGSTVNSRITVSLTCSCANTFSRVGS